MKFEPKEPPQFSTGPDGRPVVVTLDVKTYVALLVEANVTDPELWPPGSKEGATALARVREIESTCIAQYGQFDWEKLTSASQDEYDALCVFLDTLHDDNDPVSWTEYKARHAENSS